MNYQSTGSARARKQSLSSLLSTCSRHRSRSGQAALQNKKGQSHILRVNIAVVLVLQSMPACRSIMSGAFPHLSFGLWHIINVYDLEFQEGLWSTHTFTHRTQSQLLCKEEDQSEVFYAQEDQLEVFYVREDQSKLLCKEEDQSRQLHSLMIWFLNVS